MNRSNQFFQAMNAYDEDRTEDALLLMEECAEQGDPVACFLTALWYQNGEGTHVDLKRSAYWLERLEELAERGNAEAQWEIGQQYRFGNLRTLDVDQANQWLERAAKSGFAEAQHHLAWYLETGQYNYPIDPKLADKWYQQALEQEHPETLYVYALRMYRDGLPTEEAIHLLRKAADKGFKQAAAVLRSGTH